jgi:hypothetical protein
MRMKWRRRRRWRRTRRRRRRTDRIRICEGILALVRVQPCFFITFYSLESPTHRHSILLHIETLMESTLG